MSDKPPPVTVPILARCCKKCGKALAFTAPNHAFVAMGGEGEILTRALWASGAAEVAPSTWWCWLCTRQVPSVALAADASRDRSAYPVLVGGRWRGAAVEGAVRRDALANAAADLADLGGQMSRYDQRQRGDEIRARLTQREKDAGMEAFDLLAEHEPPGYFLDGRWARLHREVASLVLSNRRLQ